MGLVLKTPPAADPVTLVEAKKQCYVDTSDDDDLIAGYIKAATDHLDGPRGILNYCIIKQSWYAYFDAFPSGSNLVIDAWPVTAIDAIEYRNSGGSWTTFSNTLYATDFTTGNGWISLAEGASWPTPANTINAVRVTFVAGYDLEDEGAVAPSGLFLAIKMMVAHWYLNREAVTVGDQGFKMPLAVDDLINKYRRRYSL